MKQIIVNVSGLSEKERQRVNEALAKITGVTELLVVPDDAGWLFAPSTSGRNIVSWNFPGDPAMSTHTPQQVLEMAEKRKVRKDFDPTKEYSVDVSNCTEDEKKKVQQGFFDAGFPWEVGGKWYQHLDVVQYSNTTEGGHVTKFCMYSETIEECNMTPDEFFSYVYEPVQQGHTEDAENTEFLPQIVRIPQIRTLLSAALPIHRGILTEDMLLQKAKEVNLLDHLKLEYTADRVEVYMKVGEIEG